jgi:hypothetical protein
MSTSWVKYVFTFILQYSILLLFPLPMFLSTSFDLFTHMYFRHSTFISFSLILSLQLRFSEGKPLKTYSCYSFLCFVFVLVAQSLPWMLSKGSTRIYYVYTRLDRPRVPRPTHRRDFEITLRHTTFIRTALDERSAWQHKTYETEFTPPMGFEALIPIWQRPQAHILDHGATGLDTTA